MTTTAARKIKVKMDVIVKIGDENIVHLLIS